jgi:uncharacterized protein (DUF302 family)
MTARRQLSPRGSVNEVCNPHQAKKVLDADGAISTALPCAFQCMAR